MISIINMSETNLNESAKPQCLLMRLFVAAILVFGSLPYLMAYDLSVEKEVNNPRPTGGDQTIEFKVKVTHLGGNPTNMVVIRDLLPDEMKLPDVMAPYVSRGEYDVDSGEWRIGTLESGQQEVLVIPAIFKEDTQAPCAINIAKLATRDETFSNDESKVLVYGPGADNCVDLWITASKEVDVKKPCDPDKQVTYTFDVHNNGPEDARNVTFSISEVGQFKMPGLRFISPGCGKLDCSILLIEAGESHSVVAQSKVFSAQPAEGHSLRMSAVTESYDYFSDNDSGTGNFTFGGNTGFCLGGGSAGTPSGCFIATAAYGTPLDERITVLRKFRDQWLINSAPGRALVETYYQYSPPIADFIANHSTLRALVRGLLYPVLFAIRYPMLVPMSFLAVLLISLRWRKTHIRG